MTTMLCYETSDPDEPIVADSRLLSRREVAALFGVSPHTIYRWACEGRLPVLLTLGGRRRYPADEITRLAQGQSIPVRASLRSDRGGKQ
jgi:excisionase family DNA binding protein